MGTKFDCPCWILESLNTQWLWLRLFQNQVELLEVLSWWIRHRVIM